jgi:hypothetical protein
MTAFGGKGGCDQKAFLHSPSGMRPWFRKQLTFGPHAGHQVGLRVDADALCWSSYDAMAVIELGPEVGLAVAQRALLQKPAP